jgi:large subunit ribosomal protein L6
MSRIGKSPIPVPSGVDVSISDRHVAVKGPQGQLDRDLPGEITIRREDSNLIVERPNAHSHQRKGNRQGESRPGRGGHP